MLLKQLSSYAVIGFISTLIHAVVAMFAIYQFGISSMIANVIAFLIALTFSYIGNASIVFKASLSNRNFIRFVSINGLSITLVAYTSHLIDGTQIPPYFSVLLAIIIVPGIGFFAHKYWTFSTDTTANPVEGTE